MTWTIPFIPPSLNKFAGRENVWAYRAEKERWKEICCAFIRPRPKTPPPFADVRITFYFPNKMRHDADNYLKLLLDGLVFAGAITDDSFDAISLTVEGRHDKKNPRTEIEINERRTI